MPRNGSGTYTLPVGNPVAPGTTIESTWANTTLSDIGTELTNSLSRTGAGGMLAAFRLADGTQAAPGVAFLNETGTGFYRAGSGEMWANVQGLQIQQFTVNGVMIPTGKTFTAQGDSTLANLSYTGTLTGGTGVVNLGSGQFYKDASGNVGIGTSSPTNTLSVVGNANITGNTTLGDASTDTVQVNGYMGVGGAANASFAINAVSSALTGTTNTGVNSQIVGSTSATSEVSAYRARPGTAAAAYTVGNTYGLSVFDLAKGAGSTVTNQVGIAVADQTQGTNNYGIASAVSSGANKWNIYASGTAANYFAGNVGIGTSSPSDLVTGVKNGAVFVAADVASNPSTTDIGVTTGGVSYVAASRRGTGTYLPLAFYTSGSERMRLDSSGNLGLGVTPSAWSGYGLPVLELPSGGTIMAAGGSSNWIANAYYTGGTLVYKTTATASYFQQNAGAFNWYTAPSGTAGTAITFTQAMTLDSSANLTVANTGTFAKGSAAGTPTLIFAKNDGNQNSDRGVAIDWVSPGTGLGVSGSRTTGRIISASSFAGTQGGYLRFDTENTSGTVVERMRLDASGNLGIGTSSPGAKLDVSAAASGSTVVAKITNAVAAAANNQAVLSLDTNNGGFNVRDAQIRAINNGSNQVSMAFYTANAATPAEAMRLDASGNLGIGTASPGAKLDVSGGSSRATGTGSSYAQINGGNADGAYLQLNRGGSGTQNAYISQFQGALNIKNLDSGPIVFTNTTSDTERARITSGGDVGIGTTAPQSKMEIRQATGGSVVNALTLSNYVGASVGTGVALHFDPNGAGSLARTASIQSVQATSGNYADLRFFVSNSTTPAEAARIDVAGNVQVRSGAVVVYAPAPASISTTATLTNANIQAQIINTTGTSYTVTMPLGTTLETLVTWATTDLGYNFTVINTASGTITMAANTGVTTLGGLTIATGTSAQFRIRRTAANTFVMYRLS